MQTRMFAPHELEQLKIKWLREAMAKCCTGTTLAERANDRAALEAHIEELERGG